MRADLRITFAAGLFGLITPVCFAQDVDVPQAEDMIDVVDSDAPVLMEMVKIPAPDDVGLIGFDAAVADFGELIQGEEIRHAYFFLNNGTAPIHIERAFSHTPGVTVSVSSRAIEPDEVGQIDVKLNTAHMEGGQNIRIRVLSDAHNAPSTLYMRGTVVPAEPEAEETEEAADAENDPAA